MMQAAQEDLAECADAEIVHNLAEVQACKSQQKFYILAGAEGLASIGDSLERLDKLYEFGVRLAMLTWNEENQLASGVRGNPDHGLTDLGRRVLRHMEDKHMIIDVSHLNEKSFWDVADVVSTPFIASHSNARALASASRNLTDEQLRVIAQSGGIVGLNAFNEFISDDPAAQTVDGLVKHAVYLAEKIGVEHLAFGFDFSGYVSQEAIRSFSSGTTPDTVDLENYTKVPGFAEKLRAVGFTDADLEKMGHGNWLRIIEQILG